MFSRLSQTTTVLATLLALAPATTYALGCYRGGLMYDELHGGKLSLRNGHGSEVFNDIFTQCTKLAGNTFHKGDNAKTLCTEWAVTEEDSCYDVCINGCGSVGNGGRGGESASSFCKLGCDPNCGQALGGKNHIRWVVVHGNGPDGDIVLRQEDCLKAFETEVIGCASGSEQNHGGLWYRIDPNEGPCDCTQGGC